MTHKELNNLSWERDATYERGRTTKRVIQHMIGFGDGGDYSMRQSYALHQALEKAFIALSGEQQLGGMGYEYDKEMAEDSWSQIVATIQQISIGLTGYKVKFIKDK